jgi:hypothetical protein
VMPSLFSLIVFASVFAGGLFGMRVGPKLPTEHANCDSKDVVRLAMALVAMMVALVLGLLVASAKTFYDTQNNEVTQLAANVVLLDGVLAHYGPEAADTRGFLRDDVARWVQLIHPATGLRQKEFLLDKIQGLSPKDDNQKAMKEQACDLAIQMGQVRWLMFAQHSVPVPKLLLFMLLFWLIVLFFSFGLFAPHNFTVTTGLFVAALAVAGAIFLILEMYQPHNGLIQISDAPLRAALAQLRQ